MNNRSYASPRPSIPSFFSCYHVDIKSFCFYVLKIFLKNLNFFYLKLIFLFFYYFDVLMLK